MERVHTRGHPGEHGCMCGLGLLTWVYPPGLVDRVVAACGRAEHRRRLLPARLVVYFMLALALFSPAPHLEVMRHMVEGLRGQGLLGDWHIPAKSSLFRARQRLGSEPLRVLFTTTAQPMGTEATPGCFWRGPRLLAVDATCWDVADSPANEAAFGRPRNARGHDKSCFPQVRMAGLIEVGTHLVLDAELAGCRTGEVTLVGLLPRSCGEGQLVLADWEFLGVPLWRAFAATGSYRQGEDRTGEREWGLDPVAELRLPPEEYSGPGLVVMAKRPGLTIIRNRSGTGSSARTHHLRPTAVFRSDTPRGPSPARRPACRNRVASAVSSHLTW